MHIWYKTILFVILVAVNKKHFHPECVANNFFFLAIPLISRRTVRFIPLRASAQHSIIVICDLFIYQYMYMCLVLILLLFIITLL
jgi:hypothetical protein